MNTYIDILSGANCEPVSTPCEIIGIYAIHHALTDSGFTAVAWTVTAIEFGRQLATFYNEKVACNFARWLTEEYGDLNPLFARIKSELPSAADQEFIDYLKSRSRHETNIVCHHDSEGDIIYVPLKSGGAS